MNVVGRVASISKVFDAVHIQKSSGAENGLLLQVVERGMTAYKLFHFPY